MSGRAPTPPRLLHLQSGAAKPPTGATPARIPPFYSSLRHCLGLSSLPTSCQADCPIFWVVASFGLRLFPLFEPRSRPDEFCMFGCYPHIFIAGLPQLDYSYLFTLDVPQNDELSFMARLHDFTREKVVKSSRYVSFPVSVFAGIAALAPLRYIFALSHGSRGLIGLSCQARPHASGSDPVHNQRVAVLTDAYNHPSA